jgi:hypothetical protein
MLNRRRFITLIPVAAIGILGATSAQAQEKLSETDPTGQALGYKEDATKVDAKKFAAYKAGNNCAGCTLYSGKAGAANGPCSAFGGKLVTAKGWCSAYAKKA